VLCCVCNACMHEQCILWQCELTFLGTYVGSIVSDCSVTGAFREHTCVSYRSSTQDSSDTVFSMAGEH
jgi:hypothetical protein